MQQHVVNALEMVRNYIKQPIRINSGYRCPEHNKAVGGKSNSAHTRGLAVDIDCPKEKSGYRYDLVTCLIRHGFLRIGIYDNWIHADMDFTLPDEQMWVG